jgi:hypothetical protein
VIFDDPNMTPLYLNEATLATNFDATARRRLSIAETLRMRCERAASLRV